jgi:hypothetical protein
VSTDRERLRAAYEATAYRVDDGPRGRFTIRVGAWSEDVDAVLAAAGAECWAFITATNPRSVPLSDAENAARMNRLTDAVVRRGLPHHHGAGVGSGTDWPAEPSLLVLGLDEAAALALAREFDQHAIVVGRRGEPARLLWSAGDAA